jgi:hypothetical protein
MGTKEGEDSLLMRVRRECKVLSREQTKKAHPKRIGLIDA